MTELNYWTLLLVMDGLLMFMGLHLIFGTISQKEKWTTFHKSRIMAGCSFIVTPIAGVCFYYIRLNDLAFPGFATAVNLTAYYFSVMLFAISYLLLIGKRYDDLKTKFIIMFLACIIYLIFTWGGILLDMDAVIKPGHIIANIMLVVLVFSVGLNIYNIYRRTEVQVDNYYSDEVLVHIKWIGQSLYLFCGLGVIACISPFSKNYSIYLCAVYLLYQVGVFIYIYNSFRGFELMALTLSGSYDDEEVDEMAAKEPKSVVINHEAIKNIENGISKWIKQCGYCQRGITVKSVALDICTNRTYLSSYINTTFHLTFKAWIAHLRIDEAKKLLCEYDGCSISDIAIKIGFSNPAIFIQTFTKLEGVSPSKWKSNNVRSNSHLAKAR